MVSILGTYQNGFLKLDKYYPTSTPVKVIITFLEEVKSDAEKGMALADFSFAKSRENLQRVIQRRGSGGAADRAMRTLLGTFRDF